MQRAYLSLLILLLTVNTAGFIWTAVLDVRQPYELDYGEGIVLYQASKITDLASSYKPLNQYPYVVFHYPPVYELTVRTLGRLSGDVLTSARWVSFISGLLIQLIFGLLILCSLPRRIESRVRYTGALFAALLPSVLPGIWWTTLARVDTLALFLSFAGTFLFILNTRRPLLDYGVFALFVAAVFTKQTMIAAPMACLMVAVLVDWKHALRLTLFLAVSGATILGILAWLTHGEVIKHLFLYNLNTFSITKMVFGVADNYSLMIPVAALAIACAALVMAQILPLVCGRRWQMLQTIMVKPHRRLAAVFVLLLVGATLLSLTYGKTGASENYFLEANLASCPLAAMVLCTALHRWHEPKRWNSAVLVLFLLPLLALVPTIPRSLIRLTSRNSTQFQKQSADDFHDVVDLVRQARKPVFSEDILVLVKAEKEVPAEPAIVRELALTALWDERPFVEMIRTHKFSFIVITTDLSNANRFTRAVAGAIRESYPEIRRIGMFKIYETRPGAQD